MLLPSLAMVLCVLRFISLELVIYPNKDGNQSYMNTPEAPKTRPGIVLNNSTDSCGILVVLLQAAFVDLIRPYYPSLHPIATI